jgi:hypothetical protein
MAARKFDMAAAVANNLVEVEPENSSWRINLALCPRVAAMASKKVESDLKVSYPVAIEG